MANGLFVWAGGRWCEVDAVTGRVRGWRKRARFVYRARGRLRVASTAAVLRGLRGLLAGQPTTVRDSAPLYQRRCKPHSRPQKSSCELCKHCQAAKDSRGCTNNNIVPIPKVRLEAQRSTETTDTGVQVTLPSQPRAPPERGAPRAQRPCSTSSEPAEPEVIKRQVLVDVHKPSSHHRLAPEARSDGHSQKSSQETKELIINEDDVDIYRSYLLKHDPKFDVYRFDTDEEYKMNVFFRINPLVNIERSARIERILRASQSSQEMSLKDFATKLGLRSISDQDSDTNKRYKMRRREEVKLHELTSDEDPDKENIIEGRVRKDYLNIKSKEKEIQSKKWEPLESRRNLIDSNKKKSNQITQGTSKDVREKTGVRVEENASDSDNAFTKPAKKFPIARAMPGGSTSAVGSLKAYSPLEDHAIVAWVSAGARARQVNGNRMWRELQGQFRRIAGKERTWQSLRNRYLRYILPALGALAIPPPHASRLRAAAAAGELKSKARVARRNSIFACAPVRSASARRPRRLPQESSDASESQTRRLLRSSAVHSPSRPEQRAKPDDETIDKRDKSADKRDKSADKRDKSKDKRHKVENALNDDDENQHVRAKLRDRSSKRNQMQTHDTNHAAQEHRLKDKSEDIRNRSREARARTRDQSRNNYQMRDESDSSVQSVEETKNSKNNKNKSQDRSEDTKKQRESRAKRSDQSKNKNLDQTDSDSHTREQSKDKRNKSQNKSEDKKHEPGPKLRDRSNNKSVHRSNSTDDFTDGETKKSKKKDTHRKSQQVRKKLRDRSNKSIASQLLDSSTDVSSEEDERENKIYVSRDRSNNKKNRNKSDTDSEESISSGEQFEIFKRNKKMESSRNRSRTKRDKKVDSKNHIRSISISSGESADEIIGTEELILPNIRDRSREARAKQRDRSRRGASRQTDDQTDSDDSDESNHRQVSRKDKNISRIRHSGRSQERLSRTPTYAQLSRQVTSRQRSTPVDAGAPARRTRKLYNHNAPAVLR